MAEKVIIGSCAIWRTRQVQKAPELEEAYCLPGSRCDPCDGCDLWGSIKRKDIDIVKNGAAGVVPSQEALV